MAEINSQEESAPKILSLYEFEYRLLPYLVHQCSQREIHPLGLADKESMQSFVDSNFDRVTWNWEDYRSTVKKINESVVILFWFPEPDMAPLAKFAATVVSSKGLTYYTLEIDEYENKTTWYLCSQNTESHLNLGQVNECKTMEDFISLLQSRSIIPGGESKLSKIKDRIKGLFNSTKD